VNQHSHATSDGSGYFVDGFFVVFFFFIFFKFCSCLRFPRSSSVLNTEELILYR